MPSEDMRIEDTGPAPQSFDIERSAIENNDYRAVAWSGRHLQVTLMSIPIGGEIGLESHPDTDQFIRLETGEGRVLMGPAKDQMTFDEKVSDGWCVLAPAGSWHNIINIGPTPMQLYTIYAPAHHAPGKVQATAAIASADTDDRTCHADETLVAPTPVTSRLRVLLVDDEELVRVCTADVLVDLGYDVIEAASGEQALRLLDEGPAPDVLVTDYLMPGMSGADLAQAARARKPGLPILIVSGYANPDGIASDVSRLRKPFRSAELAQSIANLVRHDVAGGS